MTQKEQTRLQVLNSVLADQVPVCQAAQVLGVSERHMRRILAAYGKEGAAALAHGNRGRRLANTTTETKMTYVVQLARTRYAGTNHTHLTELLIEREGIDLSRSTVRRILVSAGMDQIPITDRTRLLSDNGPGYVSRAFRDYPGMVGIKHILATPFHPQTNGKLERYHQTLKRDVNQLPCEMPSDLEAAFVSYYNYRRYHKAWETSHHPTSSREGGRRSY